MSKQFKSWTLQDISLVIEEGKHKLEDTMFTPDITITNRTTRRLGVCTNTVNGFGKVVSTKLSFSKEVIDGTFPEDIVREIILHEYIHHYTNMTQGVVCGHNSIFKGYCRKLGLKTDKSTIDVSKYSDYKPTRRKRKYRVTCTECGSSFDRVSFRYGVDNFIDRYRCGHCNGKFIVENL